MSKIIILELTDIRYSGKSIGDDIRIEIDVLGGTIQFNTKLKRNESVQPNLRIGTVKIFQKTKTIPLAIRVIEHDVLFPDKGGIKTSLKINPGMPFPQTFVHAVEVKEFRGFPTKSIALFEIIIEANIAHAGKKRIPTVDDPCWTGDFRDDPDDILLARLIFGEAEDQSKEAKIWVGGSVLNRIRMKAWPNTLYDVILQKGKFLKKIDDTSFYWSPN